jgi:hypothetical protein
MLIFRGRKSAALKEHGACGLFCLKGASQSASQSKGWQEVQAQDP